MSRAASLALIAGLASALCTPGRGSAEEKPLKVGILADMSSSYSSHGGKYSVEVARMAIQDVGGKVGGRPVELVVADQQNKPDVASAIVRRWIDADGVDVVGDIASSPVALAVTALTAERNKVALVSGSVSSDLTGKGCTATSSQWIPDTYASATALVPAVSAPGQGWAFVTVDNAGGKNVLESAKNAVERSGGTVVSSQFHPLNAPDFSAYLLAAQASGAQAIGFANAGDDTVNAVKQAHEFGLAAQMKITAILLGLTDVHAIGLDEANGLYLSTNFYWDRNDASRTWAKRFQAAEGVMPDNYQAGLYQALRQYFRAVEKTGSTDGNAVTAEMKRLPIEGDLFQNARLNEAGLLTSDMFVVQVKSPSASRYPFDYFTVLKTVPAAQAYLPAAQSQCHLAASAPPP